MTISQYPQPDSNIPALSGLDYFRLTQKPISPGDIYESEQSAHAIAIGPDSDYARVTVLYYDDNKDNPTRMTQTIISPDRAFVGTVNARNDAAYLPANRQARVLFYASDVFQPAYDPAVPLNGDRSLLIEPSLDVIQYFTEQPSLTPARNDRVFELTDFNWAPTIANGFFYLTLPYYGRSYANINITNRTDIGGSPNTISLSIIGVNFTTGPTHQNTTLLASTNILSQASLNVKLRAAVDGEFDVLTFKVQCPTTGIVRIPFRVVMSDLPQ